MSLKLTLSSVDSEKYTSYGPKLELKKGVFFAPCQHPD